MDKEQIIKLLLSVHKDNILVFEYDKDSIDCKELYEFKERVSELLDNKAVFIPKTMTVSTESDVDFLIESYTQVVRFLEKLKTRVSKDTEE